MHRLTTQRFEYCQQTIMGYEWISIVGFYENTGKILGGAVETLLGRLGPNEYRE